VSRSSRFEVKLVGGAAAVASAVIVSALGCRESTRQAPTRVAMAHPAPRPCTGESLDRVRRVVAAQLNLAVEKVDVRRPLAELRADDLDVVEIVMAIEEECSVTIEDTELRVQNPGATTVEGLARIVDRKAR
jgi:acyl carrier protein